MKKGFCISSKISFEEGDVTTMPQRDCNQGTPFQNGVWDALASIPSGETRTYGEIAQEIDRPMAFRAVAAACGANPFPGLVPCHRVVAKDGWGGFSAPGGLTLKIRMVNAEK